MRRTLRLSLLGAISAAALAACGPFISVSRMAFFPAKPETCELKILNGATADPSLWMPGGEYEMAGMIGLGETGIQDPFSDRYLALVRPKACAMGGDAISLMASSQNAGPLGPSSTSTEYLVLHRRQGAPSTSPTGLTKL